MEAKATTYRIVGRNDHTGELITLRSGFSTIKEAKENRKFSGDLVFEIPTEKMVHPDLWAWEWEKSDPTSYVYLTYEVLKERTNTGVEGRKCWIGEASGSIYGESANPIGLVPGLAFTLPEIAARDAQIRREALMEFATKLQKNVEVLRGVPQYQEALQVVDSVCALAEKEGE